MQNQSWLAASIGSLPILNYAKGRTNSSITRQVASQVYSSLYLVLYSGATFISKTLSLSFMSRLVSSSPYAHVPTLNPLFREAVPVFLSQLSSCYTYLPARQKTTFPTTR